MPEVRSIVANWRHLTGGPAQPDLNRRTLVACSGGSDSSALTIALAAALRGTRAHARRPVIVVAHIQHDLRTEQLAAADAEHAQTLSDELELPFVSRRIEPSTLAGNAEANARRLRYEALAALAAETGCPFVATGHHADDQLETVLMAVARGSGLQGLSGMPQHRELAAGVSLIRPMLSLSADQARDVCSKAHWPWAEDHTNQDLSRQRARIRHQVMPAILTAFPETRERLAGVTAITTEAARVIQNEADQLWLHASRSDQSIMWPRRAFSRKSWLVISTHLRDAFASLTQGQHLDDVALRSVRPVAEKLSSAELIEPHRSLWAGIAVEVRREEFVMAVAPKSVTDL